ncbi:MAG: hypothetical protein AAF961_05745, partial [Planctomycetota bacterium]
MYGSNATRSALFLLASAGLSCLANSSDAALFARRAAPVEASDPAALQYHRTATVVAPEEILPAAPVRTLVSPSCIVYKMHKQGKRICCDCPPPMRTVLAVENPRDRCCYAVPVCLPGCCVRPPTVDCRRGLFGRSIVTYRWCCGFEIRVIFRARGDV